MMVLKLIQLQGQGADLFIHKRGNRGHVMA